MPTAPRYLVEQAVCLFASAGLRDGEGVVLMMASEKHPQCGACFGDDNSIGVSEISQLATSPINCRSQSWL